VTHAPAFTPTFDRAIAACARAQVLLVRSVEASTRSRELRVSSNRIRRNALESREAWRGADRVNVAMRRQVLGVARAMRAAGATELEAGAAVRARMRFVLYDDGLREQEAEPLITRATMWVAECYRAA
jgi:hypothetical protein